MSDILTNYSFKNGEDSALCHWFCPVKIQSDMPLWFLLLDYIILTIFSWDTFPEQHPCLLPRLD